VHFIRGRLVHICREIAGHVIPSSTFKIAVSHKIVVSASTRTFIVLRAASVNSLLRESGSGTSSSFNRVPTIRSACRRCLSIFHNFPTWLLSATAAHSKCQIWDLTCWTKNACPPCPCSQPCFLQDRPMFFARSAQMWEVYGSQACLY